MSGGVVLRRSIPEGQTARPAGADRGGARRPPKPRPAAKPKAKPAATLPDTPTYQQLQEALERAGRYMNAIASHVDGLPGKARFSLLLESDRATTLAQRGKAVQA